MILFYNVFFLSQWLMRFLVCIARIHSKTLKKIPLLQHWLKNYVDYETDLDNYLKKHYMTLYQ